MERINKEHKEKILEKINPDTHEISWNEGGVPYKFKKKSEIKKGKSSKARGGRFELQVRKDLESKGRVNDKWNNNVDLELTPQGCIPNEGTRTSNEAPKIKDFTRGKMIIAKRKYNPFSKVMTIGTGFPDFISIKHVYGEMYSVIGVEVKMNGTLSKIEKEKCAWYLKNKIFSQIWIARKGITPKGVPRDISKEISTGGKKGEKRGMIVYDDFEEKYGKKYN